MSRFTFDLATPADHGALASLLAATPMEGAISVAFAREPSYFAAAPVDGHRVQVCVVRDREAGRIIGMGSRATSIRYVDGKTAPVGYLSGLRLLAEYRGNAGLLARGYRFLRELHADGDVDYYLTTIAADNPAARVLTSARAGLPVYHPCGDYHTLAISASRFSRNVAVDDPATKVRPAEISDRAAILAFLNEYGPTRQFFPAYDRQDLFSPGGLLQGLRPADILLAVRDGQIEGMLGCWDQCRFKQIILHAYHGLLAQFRPFYNVWAMLRREPILPPARSMLAVKLAAIPVVRQDNPAVLHRLIQDTLSRMACGGERLLLIGLHDTDPLLPIARQFSGRDYVTRIYLVYWPDQVPDIERIMRRVPYLELGSL